MTTPSSHPTVQQFDFDALYRGESPAEGVPPFKTPPWDDNAPRENVIGWQADGLVHGEVLDIGCGLGDDAIYLARQGHAVTGLDISPTALITAVRRAKDAAVNVRFAVADATKLDGYTDAFDTVIDSGTYHCLDDDAKCRYGAALHRATRPRARLLLTCFSDANAADPERSLPVVSEAILRDTLGGAGWDIISLEPITAVTSTGEAGSAFWRVHAERR